VELKDVLNALRAGWWLVVGTALAAMAAAGVLSWLATPTYISSTQLFVSTSASTDTSAAYQGNLFSQQRVASYAELLTGVQLAAVVVEDLGLDVSPPTLAGQVTAAVVPETVILRVTVTDVSPQRAQDIAESLARHFAERVSELETPAGAGSSTVKVAVVEEAAYNSTPVSPNVQQNLILGLAIGLLVGVGIALLRTMLDNTIKSAEDVTAVTGKGVIGTILEDPMLADTHLVSDLDQQSVSAEAFRSIRTNLQFLDVDSPPRVIVVSSSLPGEGKSTLAVNLATLLAQTGSRVTLIEADLRRPRVTRYMGLISGAGLTNVLAGTVSLHDVAQPWGDGKLTVLAAGPMPPNPSEMLGSTQMRALLDDLRQTNDFVVIDAPPLLAVTDAALLAVLSDGCVLATRYGATRREQLAEAAATLDRIDAKLLGVILNRVPQAVAMAHGYGYGYGYETDPGRVATGSSDRRPGRQKRQPRGRERVGSTGLVQSGRTGR
jgi:succinoglycan biosynthesis transport protein ExoP